MEAPFREQGSGKVSCNEKLRASCQGSLLFGCIIPHFTNHLSRSPIAQLILPFTTLITGWCLQMAFPLPIFTDSQQRNHSTQVNDGLRSSSRRNQYTFHCPSSSCALAFGRDPMPMCILAFGLGTPSSWSVHIKTSTDRNIVLSVWAVTYIYRNTQDTLNRYRRMISVFLLAPCATPTSQLFCIFTGSYPKLLPRFFSVPILRQYTGNEAKRT